MNIDVSFIDIMMFLITLMGHALFLSMHGFSSYSFISPLSTFLSLIKTHSYTALGSKRYGLLLHTFNITFHCCSFLSLSKYSVEHAENTAQKPTCHGFLLTSMYIFIRVIDMSSASFPDIVRRPCFRKRDNI